MAWPGRMHSFGRVEFRSTQKHDIATGLYERVKRRAKSAEGAMRLYDKYRLDDRRKSRKTLIVMLAGYKPELWSHVFRRFEMAIVDADICIVTPGKRVERLATVCGEKGWSYLTTSTNDVALAQNIALKLHVEAELVVKLDEDMFLLPDTIACLIQEYKDIKAEGIIDPGFVAPVIPLNGLTYRYLLQTLGLLDEYEARFGIARLATAGLAIQNDPEAARWIWEHTVPLEKTADVLRRRPKERMCCPIQFSIGLIVFERSFWEHIGYFIVHRRRLLMGISTLGGDEAWLCARAQELSRPGVITSMAFAAHFAFGPQYSAQRKLFVEQPELFGVERPLL